MRHLYRPGPEPGRHKGPFAHRYVPRALREIISAGAGANDGFGFQFLMLATNLMPHGAARRCVEAVQGGRHRDRRHVVVHRLHVGPLRRADRARRSYAIKYCLRRKRIDHETYLLLPVALALFIVGTAGALGTNDLLACFCAGVALNWDGEYLAKTLERHDEADSSIDALLNFMGFMYVGAIMPWSIFHDPEGTATTIGRLIGLGFLVLLFRRIPAIMLLYRAPPTSVKS